MHPSEVDLNKLNKIVLGWELVKYIGLMSRFNFTPKTPGGDFTDLFKTDTVQVTVLNAFTLFGQPSL